MSQTVLLETTDLTADFDTATGFLRNIRFRDVEVLRGVYAAVRDHNWDTIEPEIEHLTFNNAPGRFCLTFTASCRRAEIDFSWQGTVRGDDTGRIVYEFEGTSHSTFRRNRIGFCVLHPPQCAGLPCQMGDIDGATSQSQFPDFISPYQPMKNLHSLRHSPTPDLAVEVRMEGDTFEMEDQRNWTDASFKTYCTPLGEPFPVVVDAGSSIQQCVTLSVQELDDARRPAHLVHHGTQPGNTISIASDQDAPSFPLPSLGLGMASDGKRLNERQVRLLRALVPAHLRVDIDFSESAALNRLNDAAAEAQKLGSALEVALFLSGHAEDQLQQVAEFACGNKVPVARWLLFHDQEKTTDVKWIRLARQVFDARSLDAPLYSGTNAYFAELNRARPTGAQLDGVCYSINPQVHAFDDASIMETSGMQAETVRSTRSFLPDLPIAVSPVTLRPRFNPNATGPEPEPGPGEHPSQVDPRQPTCFAAAWTLASLKYLCESHVASITYYETIGWRGIMEAEAGSGAPGKLPTPPGAVFPVFHVLADVGGWRDARVAGCISSDPSAVVALCLDQEQQQRCLLGNLRPQPTSVRVALSKGLWKARRLNATTLHQAQTHPMEFRSTYREHFDVASKTLQLDLASYEVITLDKLEPASNHVSSTLSP